MGKVTSALIKDLRERTGAGMLDCKKALEENDANIENAVDWLRKKGLSKASKKSDRVTAEGVIVVNVESDKASLVEINSETDFVARNDKFQNFAKDVSAASLHKLGSLEDITSAKLGTTTVAESLTNLISTIGENISIRRVAYVKGNHISSYVHNAVVENMGKIGVVIAFDKAPANNAVARQLAMHVASTKPASLDVSSLDQSLVEKEKEVQRDIAKQSGKPDAIIEKMLDGRIQKFYQEVCLLEQSFIIDPDKKVKDVLKENNANIVDFKYFVLGEGIEKETVDFAEEVASTLK